MHTYMCIYTKKNMYIFTNIHIYRHVFFCCDMSMTQMAQLTCPCNACGSAPGIHCAPLVTYIFTLLYKYISIVGRGVALCALFKSVQLNSAIMVGPYNVSNSPELCTCWILQPHQFSLTAGQQPLHQTVPSEVSSGH